MVCSHKGHIYYNIRFVFSVDWKWSDWMELYVIVDVLLWTVELMEHGFFLSIYLGNMILKVMTSFLRISLTTHYSISNEIPQNDKSWTNESHNIALKSIAATVTVSYRYMLLRVLSACQRITATKQWKYNIIWFYYGLTFRKTSTNFQFLNIYKSFGRCGGGKQKHKQKQVMIIVDKGKAGSERG